ncbi:hypothetical protein C457_11491, partial [Haloferax prahovense DSM 18310]
RLRPLDRSIGAGGSRQGRLLVVRPAGDGQECVTRECETDCTARFKLHIQLLLAGFSIEPCKVDDRMLSVIR